MEKGFSAITSIVERNNRSNIMNTRLLLTKTVRLSFKSAKAKFFI